MHINDNYDSQVQQVQIPLEQIFAHRALGIPMSKPVQQQQSIEPADFPIIPSRTVTTSYIPHNIQPIEVAPEVPETPVENNVPMSSDFVFNPDDLRKAKFYQENGLWTSDNPFIRRVIQMESGGNANAVARFKGSSGRWDPKRNKLAAGVFQFTPGTGAKYGLIGDDRFDPQKSYQAFLNLTMSNIRDMQKRGIPITPTNVYLAHQQGVGGLNQILHSINTGRAITNTDLIRNMNGNRRPGVPMNASAPIWYNAWSSHVGL